MARSQRSASFLDAHAGSSSAGTRNQLVEHRRHSTPPCRSGTRRSSCSSSKRRLSDTNPAATGGRSARGRLCGGPTRAAPRGHSHRARNDLPIYRYKRKKCHQKRLCRENRDGQISEGRSTDLQAKFPPLLPQSRSTKRLPIYRSTR